MKDRATYSLPGTPELLGNATAVGSFTRVQLLRQLKQLGRPISATSRVQGVFLSVSVAGASLAAIHFNYIPI